MVSRLIAASYVVKKVASGARVIVSLSIHVSVHAYSMQNPDAKVELHLRFLCQTGFSTCNNLQAMSILYIQGSFNSHASKN